MQVSLVSLLVAFSTIASTTSEVPHRRIAAMLNTPQRKMVTDFHNDLRVKAIHGRLTNAAGEAMPTGKYMYKLRYCMIMEGLARESAGQCTREPIPKAAIYGVNTYVIPGFVSKEIALDQAFQTWLRPFTTQQYSPHIWTDFYDQYKSFLQ
ncbi:hypothetical protein AAVH_32741, partial [Aphelenchoides avenae]